MQVWEKISDDNNFLEIYPRNNDPLRGTGIVSFYRLDIDPNNPIIQLPRSGNGDELGPGEENLIITISINQKKKLVNFPVTYSQDRGDWITSEEFASKLFYASEHETMAYKITCTKCRAEGIVRKVPSFWNLTEDYIADIPYYNGTDWQVNITYFTWVDYHYTEDGSVVES